ncbi:hypothetical protein [Clostridium estertheticum]|uniref:hypothetical protein n=1 Tax=Clostridium estertheticum TaxID=238834 RepID=UPI001CF3A81F|nr:hypothetical protein [Clostridium estertheticum]MCB2339950.1 hypothetical protein [Clostridium estertheticum]
MLKDFLQHEYRKDDYLYNFYSSCVEKIESKNLPNYIYELLWCENKDNCCDIMNSFNTYMNIIVKSIINNDKSFKTAYETFKKITGASKRQQVSKQLVLYFLRNKEINEKMKKELVYMSQLAKWSNTIGNFILLPNTGLGRRGENVRKNGIGNDRMDAYLYNLKGHLKWNLKGILTEKEFREYINQNYLWEYVNKDYEVLSSFQDSDNKEVEKKLYNKEFENKLPNDPKFYESFAENIINNIKHRGMFMEIMIRLSIEASELFEKVKDTKDKNSYAEVINTIETINLPGNLMNLISEFQGKIV